MGSYIVNILHIYLPLDIKHWKKLIQNIKKKKKNYTTPDKKIVTLI